MRRRQFVASGAAMLGALAGCLGDDTRDADGAGEPSREVDWEPTAANASDGNHEDDDATTRGENEVKGDRSGGNDGGSDGGEASGKDRTNEKHTANEAFAEGVTWEADEAQVAADARKAGTAVDFKLETTPPEPCGRTCRELRAALTNTGTEDAHDVVVETELSSSGSVLRKRRDTVGDLESGETYRATERVELGAIEAVRVKRNGTLTVEHVVTSAERREVFRERIEP